ncbi:hypothetical protein [Streptomyces sp. bgisy100]|uniref:hypothetical protein n=1 Tax=Streptomyces sp. bgisy100 TaxID=3413783 RepID=UPI003D76221B
MTTTGIDLDAIPPDTPVVQNGQITPIGELIIARMAKDLAAVCQQADDPQAALKVLKEIIPKHMAEITAQRTTAEPSPLRKALTCLVGSECLERRPGHDPLTGDRIDDQPDTDHTFADRLPCTQKNGHNNDHRDALGRTWRRAEGSQ